MKIPYYRFASILHNNKVVTMRLGLYGVFCTPSFLDLMKPYLRMKLDLEYP